MKPCIAFHDTKPDITKYLNRRFPIVSLETRGQPESSISSYDSVIATKEKNLQHALTHTKRKRETVGVVRGSKFVGSGRATQRADEKCISGKKERLPITLAGTARRVERGVGGYAARKFTFQVSEVVRKVLTNVARAELFFIIRRWGWRISIVRSLRESIAWRKAEAESPRVSTWTSNDT